MKTEELMELVIKKANHKHDGHLMIIKFTTGWKVVFGTPQLHDEIPILQAIEGGLSLRDALHLAIIQEPKV